MNEIFEGRTLALSEHLVMPAHYLRFKYRNENINVRISLQLNKDQNFVILRSMQNHYHLSSHTLIRDSPERGRSYE